MYNESFYLAGYWGPRAEPIDDLAGKLVDMYSRLAEIDPLLGEWYRLGSRRPSPKDRVAVQRDTLRNMLASGRNRRDTDHSVIHELGYRVSLWNGLSTENSVALSVTCGLTIDNPNLVNSVVMNLPPPQGAQNLYQVPVADAIMRVLVDVWRPEWATLTTHSMREAQETMRPRGPVIGWISYLSAVNLQRAPLPDSVAVYGTGEGVLVRISETVEEATLPKVLEVSNVLKEKLIPIGGLRSDRS